jgi:phage-related holin
MIGMLFEGFDFGPLRVHAGWLLLIYAGVLLSMVIDLITGVRKAKAAGVARTSEGYKRSCEKAIKYFFPMMCLSCIDLMVSTLLPLPVMTMAMGAFNIFCEWKSVMEKTHEKEEMRKAERTMSIVLENK